VLRKNFEGIDEKDEINSKIFNSVFKHKEA
jgi:hypothetical protein